MTPERLLTALSQEIHLAVIMTEKEGQTCLLIHDFSGYEKVMNDLREVAGVLHIDLSEYR